MLRAMKFMHNREVQDAEIERLFEYAKANGEQVYSCESEREEDGSYGKRVDINVYRITLPSNHLIISTREEGTRWNPTTDTNFSKQYVAISFDDIFVWFAMRLTDLNSQHFSHGDELYQDSDNDADASRKWEISDDYTPEIFFTVVDSLED